MIDITPFIVLASEIEYNFLLIWFEVWGLIGKLIGGMVLGIGIVFIILWFFGTILRFNRGIRYD